MNILQIYKWSLINSSFNINDSNEENTEDDKPIKYNIISLGDSAVGKTSIFIRLKKEKFIDEYKCTIGVDCFDYHVKYKNRKYKLIFHDTSGQEQYKSLTKSYLRNSEGFNGPIETKLRYWVLDSIILLKRQTITFLCPVSFLAEVS